MKKNMEIALALLLVIAMIGVAVVAYVTGSNPPLQSFDWQVVAQISGAGRQDTTEFSMNNPWGVAWSIQKQSDNFFLVAVARADWTAHSLHSSFLYILSVFRFSNNIFSSWYHVISLWWDLNHNLNHFGPYLGLETKIWASPRFLWTFLGKSCPDSPRRSEQSDWFTARVRHSTLN
jgi:hypothetical protein